MLQSSRRGSSFGSRLKIRLAIAAIVAGVAIFGYLAKGCSPDSVNPITGERQRVALSPDEEMALGRQAAPQMVQQHNGLEPDQGAQEFVDQMGARLVQALEKYMARSDTPSGENPYQFEFHLLADDRTVNAFALPGGQVFITTALFTKFQTKGQLAGVLGHEIGHVIERHGNERLAKADLTSGLVGAAGVAGGGRESAALAAQIGSMINMKYGREAELESDKWGVRLMAEAGYDPNAMIGVMKILDEASGGEGPPEFMSTHPKPENRVEYIRSVIREEFQSGLPPNLEP